MKPLTVNQKIADHPHGTRAAYIHYRCRCVACTEANRAYQSRADAARRVRLPKVIDKLQHGNYSTYRNWGCRCRPCTTAQVIACGPYVKAWRERKKAERLSDGHKSQ